MGTTFLRGMSKSLSLMILLAHLKFCWCILNFAGTVFELKVAPAKEPRQQNSAGACQKIPSLSEFGFPIVGKSLISCLAIIGAHPEKISEWTWKKLWT
jgi:hypothetical protein